MALTDDQLAARVRETLDAFNRGDFDTAVAAAHPEIVFARPGGLSELRGAENFREWMEPDAFDSLHIELLELEAHGDRALLLQHASARGAGSGIEVELDTWSVWTFDEDGRVTRIETYLEQEDEEARRSFRAE
jgi:ketosteroid isomerase-like protein